MKFTIGSVYQIPVRQLAKAQMGTTTPKCRAANGWAAGSQGLKLQQSRTTRDSAMYYVGDLSYLMLHSRRLALHATPKTSRTQ